MTAELVALLERDRLCLDCLASKMQRRPEEVARALEELSTTLRLSQQPALCAGCLGSGSRTGWHDDAASLALDRLGVFYLDLDLEEYRLLGRDEMRHPAAELFRLHGLREEVVETGRKDAAAVVADDTADREGDQGPRPLLRLVPELLHQPVSITVRHDDIAHHDVDGLVAEHLDRFSGRLSCYDRRAAVLENDRYQFNRVRCVVDDEDPDAGEVTDARRLLAARVVELRQIRI